MSKQILKNKKCILMLNLYCITQQAHTSQNPFLGHLLGPEVKGPDEGRAALPGSINGALVHALGLLFVNWDSLDINYWHCRRQVLQVTLLDHSRKEIISA